MSRQTPRLLSLRVHIRHACRHVWDWLCLQGEYLAIGRAPITLAEVETDRQEYRNEYRHHSREHTVSVLHVKASKDRTVTISAEWQRHRDDYVRTGSLASFRHMVESVTITMGHSDPNDTPTAIR